MPRFASEALVLSLVCGIATAPVLLWRFGSVPLYSVPANVLVTPAVAPLLQCGLASAALHPLLPAACGPLAAFEGVLAAYIAGVARTFGGLPFARLGSTTALTAACVVVLVAVALRRRGLRRFAGLVDLRAGPPR